MGGKRASIRSNSGRLIQPRISSGGSTKSSVIESPTTHVHKDLSDEVSPEYQNRKSSFDIISLLESQEDATIPTPRNGESNQLISQLPEVTHGPPSFWHFVQPENSNNEIFHRQQRKKEVNHPYYNHGLNNKRNTLAPAKPLELAGGNKFANSNKRTMKRKKVKKTVQSAKEAGFKDLVKSPDRLQREGIEWIRVLSPRGTDVDSLCEADNDDDDEEEEDDELIKRYFSGLSSAGSSISWAEDAMESEFTTQLMKLWDDIEVVCRGGGRPTNMSDFVYDECLQWKKAFPNPDLHRFSNYRNEEGDLSPVTSPTFDEEIGDCDAPFSSIVHVPSHPDGVKKSVEESVNLLQASFRSLNCSTPRPNVEKCNEYVSAWLSECQNSYVADGGQSSSADNNRRTPTPSLSSRHTSSQCVDEVEKRNRPMLQTMSDGARSSYSHLSRTHAKFVAEPDPKNFFTSLAITNNEAYTPYQSKHDNMTNSVDTPPNGTFLYSYSSRINEYDEDDEDGRESPDSPIGIVSFRPNVRVQRPISSRIRDHTITPIATGSYSSPFAGRHSGINLNRQPTATSNPRSNSMPNPRSSENYRSGKIGIFDNTNTLSSNIAEITPGRIQSGFSKPGHSLSQFGRPRQSIISLGQQQAPWSRHTGEDLAAETNYVSSLYENYQSVAGSGEIPEGVIGRNDVHLRSPTSAKNGFIQYHRSSAATEGPNSIPECENQSFKPVVSWLMNRVSPH